MTDVQAVPIAIPPGYQAVIVILEEDGLRGLGEAPVVPGRGGSLETLLQELRQGRPGTASARCALQTAHCDLEARRRGVPLAELLGGRRRTSIECSALITDLRPEAVAREVERRSALGFGSFKLKAAPSAELDQERLGAARWAAGAGARLRVDFNGRLRIEQAGSRLARLEGFGVELFEQPLPAGAGLGEWRRLKACTSAALAADESLADPSTAEDLARAGVALALKLATVGGPSAALDLARHACAAVTIGSSMETSIGIAAALHVACALPERPLPCGLATTEALAGDLACGLLWQGPTVELPNAPGIGVELDQRALDAYRLDR
ncbi:MAG: mandelate racemase/muconate lactonizing enzyme family protein [Candidatus Dormibacteraeota bacterium]|nr:mandelate racemase/muconate lactonizing enzyme family protein [Candidatus Dormibacteraeota bacterium]